LNQGRRALLPSEAREALRRFLINLGLTGLSLLLLGLGGCVVLQVWMQSAPPEVKVPDLIGVEISQARSLAQKSGLKVELVGEEEESSQPENCVSWMHPPAGMAVREGRTIEVRVSVPKKTVLVPSVVGLTVDAARDTLLTRNLVGKEEKKIRTLEVPEGAVAVQSPGAGSRVAEGAVVQLFPSAGAPSPRAGKQPQKALNEVTVQVPNDGRQHQVLLRVEDNYGSREYYRGRHQGGETVSVTVESYGPAVVEVYFDGQLEARQRLR